MNRVGRRCSEAETVIVTVGLLYFNDIESFNKNPARMLLELQEVSHL